MNKIKVANSDLKIPEIALGCMRIGEMPLHEVNKLINTAMDEGITFFDHADIYGGGKSEEVFASAVKMTPAKREQMILQSKCGIREGFFDFSRKHILQSVDGILKRLQTDYLDILLLHRPDSLVEPEEVADAFDLLYKSGKVLNFGVSNQNPMQIELLKKYVKQPLLFNQLQLSIMRTGMIDAGLNVNMKVENSLDHDGSILDYCRLTELNKVIDKLAKKYTVTNSAIAVAWILRHPARIQTIIGTTNSTRVSHMAKASHIRLSREEWYEIYRSAGNILP
ncbi:MAG: aldo/keto reductase [Spirochaetaceae bacterium]|nr:aldo/keto reductase [Spirochaetaceae bacterium]